MAELYYPEGFFETTLSADLTTSATTVPLTAVPARVTKGYMIIEPSSPTKREVVHFTSVGSSSVTTADDTTDAGDATGRGCIGSITVGANTSHDQGVTVIIAATEKYWKRMYDALANVVVAATGALDTTKVVDLTTSQVLTNKTLITPIIKAYDGWITDSNTWTYASADDPTFTLTVNADVTAYIGVGDRIKLTQTTAKYFIVTAISYGAPNTTITLYGGTDYDLANAAITSPYYSHFKSPVGFPVDATKWQVTAADATYRSQSTPTQNQWYNLNAAHTISIPIGSWIVGYSCRLLGSKNSTTSVDAFSTFSTANNSESDTEMTTGCDVSGASGNLSVSTCSNKSKVLTVASKTAYYLNARTTNASVDSIGAQYTYIFARCAYL